MRNLKINIFIFFYFFFHHKNKKKINNNKACDEKEFEEFFVMADFGVYNKVEFYGKRRK